MTLSDLYAEDFGRAAPLPPPREAAPAPPQPPEITAADVEAACSHAVSEAREAWSACAEAGRLAALDAIAATLGEARRAAERDAGGLAESLARAALSTVAGLLPELCSRHGEAELKAMMARLLPVLARRQMVTVRVHADLVDTLRAELPPHLAGTVVLLPADLPAGDVRVTWEDGSLVRDTAAIRQAVEGGLHQLGLLDPTPAAAATPPAASAARVPTEGVLIHAE